MLAMLDPMALPTAHMALSSSAAIKATTISGAEVPRETTVKPIKMLETPKFVAVAAAPDRNLSALQMRAANPAAINSKLTHIRVCPVLCACGVLSSRLVYRYKTRSSLIETPHFSRITSRSQGIRATICPVRKSRLPMCSVVCVDIA